MNQWTEQLTNPGFYAGIVASIVAAAVVWLFRSSFQGIKKGRQTASENARMIERHLETSSQYAPFAYGIAQARALRLLLVAVFIAYVGDIFGLVWPFNIAFYAVSLVFLAYGIKWLLAVEKAGLAMMNELSE